jgi:hypothetical protein
MKRTPLKYYEEYRNNVVALNERTYDVFVDIYENGPLELGGIKAVQTLEILVNGGLVGQRSNGNDVVVFVTKLGQELFEGMMDVIEKYN